MRWSAKLTGGVATLVPGQRRCVVAGHGKVAGRTQSRVSAARWHGAGSRCATRDSRARIRAGRHQANAAERRRRRRFDRRARIRFGAEETWSHRRRRDRTRTRQRLESTRFRGGDSRSARGLPADRRRANRTRREEDLREPGLERAPRRARYRLVREGQIGDRDVSGQIR